MASRQDRWNKAVAVLTALQVEFQDALDNLASKENPTEAQEEMIDMLEMICDHDLSELEV